MTVTTSEFEALIEEGFDYEFEDWQGNKSTEHLDNGDFWEEAYDYGPFETEAGTLEYVDGVHGQEGGGESIWQVWKIGDQYFKKTGYYMSYEGSSWDGNVFEVIPFPKTITDWKKK